MTESNQESNLFRIRVVTGTKEDVDIEIDPFIEFGSRKYIIQANYET